MFEKKRRTSSHSTMAHRASRGGSPLLILKLAEEYNRSPAICPVTFWTATTHAWVRSTVSSLYKLVLSVPGSASFWAAVGRVLKVRVTFRFFVVFLVVFFFFFNPCVRYATVVSLFAGRTPPFPLSLVLSSGSFVPTWVTLFPDCVFLFHPSVKSVFTTVPHCCDYCQS